MVVTLYAAGSPRGAAPSTHAGTDGAAGATLTVPTVAAIPGSGPPPAERLRILLDLAAGLDLDDERAWAGLRDEAGIVIDALIAAGTVPQHLAVRIDELPVVVRRTIAAAYQRARG